MRYELHMYNRSNKFNQPSNLHDDFQRFFQISHCYMFLRLITELFNKVTVYIFHLTVIVFNNLL